MASKLFRVRGVTDDVTSCECCGRENLKRTVVLEVLDLDGNGTGHLSYFGTTCAAKAAGWTQREYREHMRQWRKEQEEERRRREFERYREEHARTMRFHAWVREMTGEELPLFGIQKLGGIGEAWRAWKAATGEEE